MIDLWIISYFFPFGRPFQPYTGEFHLFQWLVGTVFIIAVDSNNSKCSSALMTLLRCSFMITSQKCKLSREILIILNIQLFTNNMKFGKPTRSKSSHGMRARLLRKEAFWLSKSRKHFSSFIHSLPQAHVQTSTT